MQSMHIFVFTLCLLCSLVYTKELTNIYRDGTMKVLNRPGTCKNDDPNSMTADMIQCAEERTCIPMTKFNDGHCDCCVLSEPCPNDPTGCSCCYDHSDEDRIQPPGNSSCGDPNWPGNTPAIMAAYKQGQTFQCAKTGRCLEGGVPFSLQNDGMCQCCLPHRLTNIDTQGNCINVTTNAVDPTFCSCCDDHSDEEPVYRNDWPDFFTCVGVRKPIKLFDDGKIDCHMDCIEYDVQNDCQKLTAANEQVADEHVTKMWCDKLKSKKTPYFQCTSGDQAQRKCLLLAEVRDGTAQCQDGEDEDPAVHLDCTEATRNFYCGEESEKCVLVDGSEQKVHCTCSRSNRCMPLKPKSCADLINSGLAYFECPNSSPERCIAQAQVGDGLQQCEGGEDENTE